MLGEGLNWGEGGKTALLSEVPPPLVQKRLEAPLLSSSIPPPLLD